MSCMWPHVETRWVGGLVGSFLTLTEISQVNAHVSLKVSKYSNKVGHILYYNVLEKWYIRT